MTAQRMAVAVLAVVALAGCRRETTTSAPEGGDEAKPYAGAAPTALGGGPGNDGPGNDEYTYSTSGALNVLVSARCDRARMCGGEATCDGEAATIHGDELAQCGKGVHAMPLSDCAQNIRSTPCEASVALPETCTAAVLCNPHQ